MTEKAEILTRIAGGVALIVARRFEARNAGLSGASADFAEGVRAFVEKRKPVFGGR